MRVIYHPVVFEGDFEEIINKSLGFIQKDFVNIYFIDPWEKLARKLKERIEKMGKKAELMDFLGCERYKVDMDVVICDGEFHLRPFEGKLVWINPLYNEVKIIEKKWEFDKRIYLIDNYKNFGIIISTKPGQFALEIARKIGEILRKKGKNVYYFVGDEIRGLENFPWIEVWINTACPRIKDDYRSILFFNADEFLNYIRD